MGCIRNAASKNSSNITYYAKWLLPSDGPGIINVRVCLLDGMETYLLAIVWYYISLLGLLFWLSAIMAQNKRCC
jgi:hypothetical protein